MPVGFIAFMYILVSVDRSSQWVVEVFFFLSSFIYMYYMHDPPTFILLNTYLFIYLIFFFRLFHQFRLFLCCSRSSYAPQRCGYLIFFVTCFTVSNRRTHRIWIISTLFGRLVQQKILYIFFWQNRLHTFISHRNITSHMTKKDPCNARRCRFIEACYLIKEYHSPVHGKIWYSR